MKIEKIIIEALAELERAKTLHPNFPTNEFEALAVWVEEVGEVTKALLDAKHKGANREEIKTEAIQAVAMGIRFIKNLREAEFATGNPVLSEMEQNIIDAKITE
ncbi:MAG: hypothetical protein QG594_470 [Bacteroidota bacterium]|nr:hypothetical protein [Bacteroidota bacterium]